MGGNIAVVIQASHGKKIRMISALYIKATSASPVDKTFIGCERARDHDASDRIGRITRGANVPLFRLARHWEGGMNKGPKARRETLE